MTETAQDVMNETMDTIEETLDILEGKGVSWLSRRPVQVSLAGAIGLAIGASVTYLVVAKKLELKYKRIADEEIKDVKGRYSILRKEGEYSDPATLAAKYEDPAKEVVEQIVETEGYKSYDKVESNVEVPKNESVLTVTAEMKETNPAEVVSEVKEEVVRNIFDSDHPDTYWNTEEELAKRAEHPNLPFIITLDEFNENEDDFEQVTLTYYEGDEVLVDERDQVVSDELNTVGPDALIRFGHGSKDKNVVYVQNNRLTLQIEVLKSEGKYAEEVLGFRHEDRPALRKFRSYD